VYFLHQFDRVVADGIWWPRWSPDFAFGYGYPFFNIYGPFSHIVGELFLHFGRMSYTGAIESVFVVSIVASAGAMYVCARDWAGRGAGLVSALVYTYLPYHLLNLYVRANLAESMAFVWLPLCLWSVRGAVVRPGVRWIVAAAIAYGGLMLTSNLVIVLFTPLLAGYVVLLAFLHALPEGATVTVWTRMVHAFKRALWPVAGLAAGLGLSAFFWVPAILEQKYVRVDQWFAGRYDFRGHFVYLYQLFSTHWGFGVSEVGPDDAIRFQIGVAALALAVIGVMVAWPRAGRMRWEIGFFAIAATLAVFVTLQLAAPLWDLPGIGTILGTAQFPWRWFSVLAPCISLLAGLVVARFPADPPVEDGGTSSPLTLPLLAVSAVVILASYPYLVVEIREPAEGPVGLPALMRFQQSSDEMTGSTAWVKEIPRWSPMADYYVQQEKLGLQVEPITTQLDYSVFDYETFGAGSLANNSVMEKVYYQNRDSVERSLVFNRFYYPGWRAFILDGEQGGPLSELPIVPEANGTLGRMTVPVPPGEGYVLLQYRDTTPRQVGRWISIATAVLLVAVALWSLVRPKARSNALVTPTDESGTTIT
jgi:hypothetical protein